MRDFYPVDSMTPDKVFITFSNNVYDYFKGALNTGKSASFALVPARVLGIDYIDYLRMVRDKYNGILRYKVGYPVCYFDNKKDAEKLCRVLQDAWNNKIKY